MEVILQNLTKKFPSRDRKNRRDVIAVNDFTFQIPDGRLIGLLGPSGCGKSTTLNLISGLVKPTSGRIFFGKDDVTDLPPEHRGIGLVFQNYALYPHLTVRQNITFPLENLKGKDKLSRAEMLEKALGAAKLVQIEELMDRKPGELSGGQQQRVAIARALVKRPKVLLLDEPLSNLDARLRLQTREEIKRIQRETGITTIFVTHDQEEAMSISDMIVVMKDGVVQQIGKPQEVYDNPVNLFVARFLGTPPVNVFEGCVRDGRLYIGQDAVLEITRPSEINVNIEAEANGDAQAAAERKSGKNMNVSAGRKIADGNVYAAIRPEGFRLQEDGPLHCELDGVEVMGRDISVVSRNRASLNLTIRSIIGTENMDRILSMERSAVKNSTGEDADMKQWASGNYADTRQQSPGMYAERGKRDRDNIVRFGLIPRKVFLFDRESEQRIYFEAVRHGG
ncbi:MAG: ABC transporter ATP-binding protein [Lachnospiraceae bacterium]|nr:ABC transporter ATP-binding protein [Lachnospiraceae bacterium]